MNLNNTGFDGFKNLLRDIKSYFRDISNRIEPSQETELMQEVPRR